MIRSGHTWPGYMMVKRTAVAVLHGYIEGIAGDSAGFPHFIYYLGVVDHYVIGGLRDDPCLDINRSWDVGRYRKAWGDCMCPKRMWSCC